MMKKIKQFIIAALMFVLITPAIVLATNTDTPPAMPLLVYGNVKIDNSPALIGTVVTVFNGATEVASTTIKPDWRIFQYSIEVPASNEGALLTYKVNGTLAKVNGTSATEKLYPNPLATPSDQIDLAITTTTTSSCNPASISNGIIGVYPQCAVTCNSGYNLSNGICVVINAGGGGGGGGGGGTFSPSPPEPPADEEDESLLDEDDEEPGELAPADDDNGEPEEEEVIVLGAEADYRTVQLEKMLDEAGYAWAGDANAVSANMGVNRDTEAEASGYNKYTSALISDLDGLEQSNIYAMTNFVVYGTPTTEILGAGERAGVLNSYKSAFGKLPSTEAEWQDAIKIANGRWPSERSEAAEAKAEAEFKTVYLREPDMDNPNDNAAVTIIAYGLRPDNRNLDSEKAAIKIFRGIFKYDPVSATDWDTVRAIAYSGAIR